MKRLFAVVAITVLSLAGTAHAARTVPVFTGSFTDGGVVHPYSMVGPGEVTVDVIPLRVVFADGTAFAGDAGARDIVASPVFRAATFDTGTTQYVDAMRRAEFPAQPRGLRLVPRVRPMVTVGVPRGAGTPGTSAFGARTGYVSLSWIDARARQLVRGLGVAPQSLALFVTQDLLFTGPKGCCTGGHHGVVTGAASGSADQPVWTYGVANWYTPGGFLFSDTTVASHEIAEWADDPFETNAVSPWISPLPLARAVYGCYGFLETGDPTIDTVFDVDGEHHLQDFTFFSWFARESPSTAFEGRYTYTDAFDGPAERC